MRLHHSRLVLAAALASLAAGLVITQACDLEHTSGDRGPVVANPPATPQPAPPTPQPLNNGCEQPRGTGNGRDCPRESPEFMDAMNAAIDRTLDEHPEFFAGGQPNVGGYMDTVVENLKKAGFCALNDGEEIAVKKTNDFSEQYDIISSGGHVLRAYMATCRPAWDAIP
jgi:hypothetical protein